MSKKKIQDDDMREEYDFSNGEVGKYAVSFPKGSNMVLLDPDVVEVFPTQESANEALRDLAQIIKRNKAAQKRKSTKSPKKMQSQKPVVSSHK